MKKRILIYDDDPEILMVCKIILESKGYHVETRLFCDDIIKDISETAPDVIFMDLWIPTIGGEIAIKLMKSNSATSHIPIILFSANSDIELIAQRTNANGFLSKPFDVRILIETIENTIAQSSAIL